jgi:hypothetical protein
LLCILHLTSECLLHGDPCVQLVYHSRLYCTCYFLFPLTKAKIMTQPQHRILVDDGSQVMSSRHCFWGIFLLRKIVLPVSSLWYALYGIIFGSYRYVLWFLTHRRRIRIERKFSRQHYQNFLILCFLLSKIGFSSVQNDVFNCIFVGLYSRTRPVRPK